MQFASPIPILRIFSVDKAKEFSLDFLGFTLLSRAGLVLHLSEHHGDATPGAAVFLPTEGIAVLHAELTAKDYAYARPGLETVDWGVQMQLRDPFGNTLRFCEWNNAPAAHAPSTVAGAPALGYYRHTDGGTYQVVGMGRDSRDGSDVVLYDHVWPFELGRWTRPLPEWASRFTRITAEEVARVQQGDRAADQARISASRRARKG
jgi:hypothetical protein